jgi:predicted nucleotidyltransferase
MVDFVQARRDQILRIARLHGVTRVRVFGSMARGDAGPESDVDLLIDVGPDPSPWFPGGLVADLEELLGRRVQAPTDMPSPCSRTDGNRADRVVSVY